MTRYNLPDSVKRARTTLSEANVYKGVASRVARKTNRSLTHVLFVLKGKRQSPRIEAELAREIALAEQASKSGKKVA